MRLFGSERIANVMDRWGAEEGEVITHGLVAKSIGRAQGKVEMNNFESRKRLLDYEKHAQEGRDGGDSRSGKTNKRVKTDTSDIDLEVPRDLTEGSPP